MYCVPDTELGYIQKRIENGSSTASTKLKEVPDATTMLFIIELSNEIALLTRPV
jgi:hypothetical protein